MNPGGEDLGGAMTTEEQVIRGSQELRYRWFLGVEGYPLIQVKKEEYVRAEQQAGFHSKQGPDEPATAGFSAGMLVGRQELYSPSLERWIQG